MKHPIQKPVMVGKVLRFTENEVVTLMVKILYKNGLSLNDLHREGNNLPKEDWEQFNQLIGYSLSGAPISVCTKDVAYKMYDEKKGEYQVRAEVAEEKLMLLKKNIKEPIATLFGIHPDDLH